MVEKYTAIETAKAFVLACINRGLPINEAILFGSYAKGEDLENSDIDLYIETPSKKGVHLEKFEKLLQRKIQIFCHKNINGITNLHLANNVLNGIILNNYLEVFR